MFKNLEAEQARKGYTNQKMAEILGISRVSYENKKKSGKFTASEIKVLCKTFGCRFDYLFHTESDEAKKSMTWNEYLELQISRGAKPELAMNSIGHMMDLYESWDWDAKVPFEVKW